VRSAPAIEERFIPNHSSAYRLAAYRYLSQGAIFHNRCSDSEFGSTRAFSPAASRGVGGLSDTARRPDAQRRGATGSSRFHRL